VGGNIYFFYEKGGNLLFRIEIRWLGMDFNVALALVGDNVVVIYDFYLASIIIFMD